jgi:tRNA A37 methylthiotransferase MiaB
MNNNGEKTFYIFNAGCIRRGMDCIQVKKYLIQNGWRMWHSPREADVVIVSTCGVVAKNQENSLKAVRAALKFSGKNARMIIIGCLPEIDRKALEQVGSFTFIPSGRLSEFDAIINPRISMKKVSELDSVNDGKEITDYLIARSFCRKSRLYKSLFDRFAMNNRFLRLSVMWFKALGNAKHWFNPKTNGKIDPYYNIKIGDGCLSSCAYCATRFATGTLRSRPPEDIIKDFNRGLERGYKYFQLISEDTGCYGRDRGQTITDLLERLFKIEGNYKIILIDFNPWWLIIEQEKLLPLLIKNQYRVKEIFMPFQSGSNAVLARMSREYTVEQLMPLLLRLRAEAPMIALRTCALVGFPGETDDDFAATKTLISTIDFAEVSINRYEDRPQTASSMMHEKISSEIIEERAHSLVREQGCKLLS